jgi:hypothetical protein
MGKISTNAIIILFSAGILVSGLLIYFLVKEGTKNKAFVVGLRQHMDTFKDKDVQKPPNPIGGRKKKFQKLKKKKRKFTSR